MKSLEINNFRCFDTLTVNLTSGINLMIGDNASGKTSILFACKYAVNCFFAGFSDVYTVWKKPVNGDFMRFNFNEKKISPNPIEIKFNFFDEDFDGPLREMCGASQTLVRKDEKNNPLITPLKQLKELGSRLRDSYISVEKETSGIHQTYALPLFASFSTHGIHHKSKINSKLFLEYQQSPTFGYYLCGDTDGLADYWIRRLLALAEADRNPIERKIVTDSLSRMFGKDGCDVMTGFDVRINSKDVYCRLNDNREVASAILSDGYRRLYSIVIDLAFRAALLNGEIYGKDAALMTKGTVIIDEIDLHLHPTLQSVVLKGLQNAFPNLQFIVSTHAPMVMSGVEKNGRNSVKYLKYDQLSRKYQIYDTDTFGMDLSTISRVILDVPPRVSSVENQINLISDLISSDDYEEAKKLLSDMRRKFGDKIPELNGMETEILISESTNDLD